MTTFENSLLLLDKMVGETDHKKVDVFLKDITIFLKHQKEEHNDRSASPDDKEKIATFFDSLNGQLLELKELAPKDIVARAGARNNQGVRMHAKRDLAKRLTYIKPAESPVDEAEASVDADPAVRPVKKSTK